MFPGCFLYGEDHVPKYIKCTLVHDIDTVPESLESIENSYLNSYYK